MNFEYANLSLQYFLIVLFFMSIISFIIWVWIYSKWQILGPKWKLKFNTLSLKIKGKFSDSKPKIQRGAVISNPDVVKEFEAETIGASTAQDLLKAQSKKNQHDREIKQLEMKRQEKEDKQKNKSKMFKKKSEPEVNIDDPDNKLEDLLKKDEK